MLGLGESEEEQRIRNRIMFKIPISDKELVDGNLPIIILVIVVIIVGLIFCFS